MTSTQYILKPLLPLICLLAVMATCVTASDVSALESELEEPLMGNINDIRSDMVVINDQAYQLTKKTRYFTASGAVSGFSAFGNEDYVTITISETPLTVLEMKKVSRAEQKANETAAKKHQPKDTPATDTTLKLKDGVWTN